MIVRELVAMLGIEMDERSFQKAERGLEGIKNAAVTLGTIFATGVVATGLRRFVDQAAEVEDVSALLETVFEDGAQGVRDWASETAAAVGRSEFALRDFASRIGALTAPVLGTGEATRQLSQDMSTLAVDLAAVFSNITDDEGALNALRSALSGQTEPLKRFGIVMTDANLQAFALSQGLNSNLKEMSEGERIQLRYQFIMARTALFQGKAAEEMSQFANASKFLEARIGDLTTRIGMVLLPAATRLVHWATDVIDGFLRLARGTKILENGLKVLGTVAAVVAVKMLLPFLPAILTASALAAAIGLVIVAVDDLLGFIEGRQSLLGEFLARAGLDADALRESLRSVGDAGAEAINFVVEGVKALLAGASNVDSMFTAIAQTFGYIVTKATEATTAVSDFFTGAWDYASAFWRSVEPLIKDTVTAIRRIVIPDALLEVVKSAAGFVQRYSRIVGRGVAAVGGEVLSRAGDMLVPQEVRQTISSGIAAVGGGIRDATARGARIRQERTSTVVRQTTNAPITVNAAPGMDEEKLAAKVQQKVAELNERQNRELQAQLNPSFASP